MSNTNASFLETMYTILYAKSLNSLDEILKMYPDMQKDINNIDWMQKWMCEHPNATERDALAHAFTMSMISYMIPIPKS